MKTYSFQYPITTALCAIVLTAPAWAAQNQITAQLDPKIIGLDEAAQLSVTIKGSQSAEPDVPSVSGLEIVPVGQQSSVQIINGKVTADITYTYQVMANRAGTFTIPAITAAGVGSTQPIDFRVNKGAGGQAQRTPSRGRSQLPTPKVDPDDSTPVDSQNQSAFLRVVLPKQELTVGELVPVEVKAYFRAGVSAALNGLPMLSSDAFSLNQLSHEPEQTRESVNGVPYNVVTWTTALSAVKAGDYPLNLDLPVMVRVKEPAKRRADRRDPFKGFFDEDSPFGDSPFDDSFFQGFFGQVTEKPMTLHTDGSVVKIKALPAQGRPPGFTGAVGKFDITGEATETTGSTGDPLKLKISITGRGNFDRVTTAGLTASTEWKSYKANEHFDPADSSNTSGTKTFEQSIVPMKAGMQEIPSVKFSFFDPDTQQYVTESTEPITVNIAQNTSAPALAPAATSVASAPAADAPKPNPDGLAPDHAVPAATTSSLRPLVIEPWFIAVNAAMLASIAFGGLFRKLRARRANDPQRLQREAAEKAVSESLAAMDAALKNKDTPRFFDAARHALQERLAAQWRVPASQVTISEIHNRLNGHGEQVSAVFTTADEIAYSGKRFTALDLQQWRDLVKNQLQKLTSI